MTAIVSIDGSSGVGKSAICTAISAELHFRKVLVLPVKFPSGETLGTLARNLLDTGGWGVALVSAADRQIIWQTEVAPNLIEYDVVLIDRYVISALALNLLEGISLDASYVLCSGLPISTSAICLSADLAIRCKRIETRGGALDKTERVAVTARLDKESQAIDQSVAFLRGRGWKIHEIDTTTGSARSIAAEVLALISGG